jgi:hypothetical protein
MLSAWFVYQHTDNGTGSIGGTLSRAIQDANWVETKGTGVIF